MLYLTLSVVQTTKSRIAAWLRIINWKERKGKWPWPSLSYYPGICSGDRGELQKKSRPRFEPGTSRKEVGNLLDALRRNQNYVEQSYYSQTRDLITKLKSLLWNFRTKPYYVQSTPTTLFIIHLNIVLLRDDSVNSSRCYVTPHIRIHARNNITTVMQRIGRQASTIEWLLETVSSVRSVQSVYKEDNWGDPNSWEFSWESAIEFRSCQSRGVRAVSWALQGRQRRYGAIVEGGKLMNIHC
jgi:hypothetical protein